MPPTLCRSSITYFPEGLDCRFSVGFLSISSNDVLQVRQEGCLVSDSLEIVNRKFNFGCPGHRKKVQDLCTHQSQRISERNNGTYGIGGTSDNINDSNGVEEGLASNDIPKGIGYRSRYSMNQRESKTHFGLRSSSIKFFKYLGALKHS